MSLGVERSVCLLCSGGVHLTVIGSNLNLVERPQMNVSRIITYADGNTEHNYTVVVGARIDVKTFLMFL